MVLQDIVVQTTVLDNIVTACRKTLPYAVAFTVEGSLKISLVTSEIIVIDVNETGEGKFKKRAKKKETINRTEDGITPPVPKRKRGRPRKVNYQEPVSESENDGDIVDNDTSGILGSESEIPDIKLETVEGVKEEVAESSDILNQQAELGMQALQSLAMQLSGEGDASSQPIEPSSSDLPATDQPPSEHDHDESWGAECSDGEASEEWMSDDDYVKGKDHQPTAKHPRQHACHMCGKILRAPQELKDHLSQHMGVRNYQCESCNKAFFWNKHLLQHKKKVHGQRSPPKLKKGKKHKKKKRNVVKFEKDIKEEEEEDFGDEQTQTSFQCCYCGELFNSRKDIRRHETSKHAGKSMNCSVCSKEFFRVEHLRRHEKIHSGEKPYQCQHCQKCFVRPEHLKVHLRMHTGEKPYQCSFCGRRFTQEGNMKIHEHTHTGVKPFQCQLCDKRFLKKCSLQVHIRTHTGEKPYTCSVCGNSYARIQHMKRHFRVHTKEKPYQCSYCGKGFARNEQLKIHERIHTGEKPYRCMYCEMAFMSRTPLAAHLKLHDIPAGQDSQPRPSFDSESETYRIGLEMAVSMNEALEKNRNISVPSRSYGRENETYRLDSEVSERIDKTRAYDHESHENESYQMGPGVSNQNQITKTRNILAGPHRQYDNENEMGPGMPDHMNKTRHVLASQARAYDRENESYHISADMADRIGLEVAASMSDVLGKMQHPN